MSTSAVPIRDVPSLPGLPAPPHRHSRDGMCLGPLTDEEWRPPLTEGYWIHPLDPPNQVSTDLATTANKKPPYMICEVDFKSWQNVPVGTGRPITFCFETGPFVGSACSRSGARGRVIHYSKEYSATLFYKLRVGTAQHDVLQLLADRVPDGVMVPIEGKVLESGVLTEVDQKPPRFFSMRSNDDEDEELGSDYQRSQWWEEECRTLWQLRIGRDWLQNSGGFMEDDLPRLYKFCTRVNSYSVKVRATGKLSQADVIGVPPALTLRVPMETDSDCNTPMDDPSPSMTRSLLAPSPTTKVTSVLRDLQITLRPHEHSKSREGLPSFCRGPSRGTTPTLKFFNNGHYIRVSPRDIVDNTFDEESLALAFDLAPPTDYIADGREWASDRSKGGRPVTFTLRRGPYTGMICNEAGASGRRFQYSREYSFSFLVPTRDIGKTRQHSHFFKRLSEEISSSGTTPLEVEGVLEDLRFPAANHLSRPEETSFVYNHPLKAAGDIPEGWQASEPVTEACRTGWHLRVGKESLARAGLWDKVGELSERHTLWGEGGKLSVRVMGHLEDESREIQDENEDGGDCMVQV